jgi:hypothetical protein
MAQEDPNSVIFIDMDGVDFDSQAILAPVRPSREFWSRTLDVALGDLATLMAPEHIVFCEGRPLSASDDRRAEFDAACYRQIFSTEFPNTDFLSVGNCLDVRNDKLEAGRAIQTIASGTKITRVIDRDMMNITEVVDARAKGVRVLSRRNIEAYLLDDNVLRKFCVSIGRPEKADEVLQIKADCLARSIGRNNSPDDLKKIGGEFYTAIRHALQLTGVGSNWNAFAQESLAPQIQPGLSVYEELKKDLFG